jgi:AraC-like DNA-binding protein
MIQNEGGAMTFSISDASHRLGLSDAHVHRLFKREVGTSLRSYLRTIRMEKAGKLLADYSAGIKTVSCNVGYSDLSNFYHDFKRVHGLSPKQFRLRHLDQETDSASKEKLDRAS